MDRHNTATIYPARPQLHSDAECAILQVSLMFTDDEPQDPLLMGPEVRPRFQSDYEEQLEGSSAPEPAVAMAKRSRGRPAKSGKWQVCFCTPQKKQSCMRRYLQVHRCRPQDA